MHSKAVMSQAEVTRILAAARKGQTRQAQLRDGEAIGRLLGGLDLLAVDGDNLTALGFTAQDVDGRVQTAQPGDVIDDVPAGEKRVQRG